MSVLLPLLLAACGEPSSTYELDARLAAVEAQLETLSAENTDQATLIADLQAQVLGLLAARDEAVAALAAAEVRIAALEADHIGVADLAGLATIEDLAALDARVLALEGDYVSADVAADLAARLASVEADYASAASVLALDGRLGLLEADYATGTELFAAQARLAAIEADYLTSASGVALVATDTSLAVADEAALTAVLAALDGMRIARDATLTLELAAGTFTFTEPLDLGHPDGARLAVQGAGTAATVLSFPDSDGIVLQRGAALGYLGDLTLLGAGGDQDGIQVLDGAVLHLGNVAVEDFGGVCLRAAGAASVRADEGLVASGCGEAGVLAEEGAFASALYASISASGTAFYARSGAVLEAFMSFADACNVGYFADGAWLDAGMGNATACTVGFSAANGALLDASDTCASGASTAYTTSFNAGIVATGYACGASVATSGNDTSNWVLGL